MNVPRQVSTRELFHELGLGDGLHPISSGMGIADQPAVRREVDNLEHRGAVEAWQQIQRDHARDQLREVNKMIARRSSGTTGKTLARS